MPEQLWHALGLRIRRIRIQEPDCAAANSSPEGGIVIPRSMTATSHRVCCAIAYRGRMSNRRFTRWSKPSPNPGWFCLSSTKITTPSLLISGSPPVHHPLRDDSCNASHINSHGKPSITRRAVLGELLSPNHHNHGLLNAVSSPGPVTSLLLGHEETGGERNKEPV